MFARLLGVDLCRGHAQYPAFAPGSSKAAVGFFGLFVSLVQNLPQLCMLALLSRPLEFLWILLLEETFVQVQSLQQRVSGLACLILTRWGQSRWVDGILETRLCKRKWTGQ